MKPYKQRNFSEQNQKWCDSRGKQKTQSERCCRSKVVDMWGMRRAWPADGGWGATESVRKGVGSLWEQRQPVRKWEPQSYNPKDLNSANNLNKLGNWHFLESPRKHPLSWHIDFGLVRYEARKPAKPTRTSDLQHPEIISLCCLEPPGLW